MALGIDIAKIQERFPEDSITLLDPHADLINELSAALLKKGVSLSHDLNWQFFSSKGSLMGYTEQCAFLPAGDPNAELFVSSFDLWATARQREAGYGFYVIVNELLALLGKS